MTLPRATKYLFAITLLVAGAALCAAQQPAASEAKAQAASASEKVKASAQSVADLQKKIADQRAGLIADHDALVKQLKDATEAERKAILQKMEAQKKAFQETSAALHKQIRDEQRRQRANVIPAKR